MSADDIRELAEDLKELVDRNFTGHVAEVLRCAAALSPQTVVAPR